MSVPRDLDELTAKVRKTCHDINQPLTVILARSELMLLQLAADHPLRRSVEQIHEQADKVATLVEALRSFAKSVQEGGS